MILRPGQLFPIGQCQAVDRLDTLVDDVRTWPVSNSPVRSLSTRSFIPRTRHRADRKRCALKVAADGATANRRLEPSLAG